MEKTEVTELFTRVGVMQKGHFRLTSGRHSDTYMQCARLFENAQAAEIICKMIADAYRAEQVDVVVGPAIGGIIMAYEVGRQLGVRNVFAERENGEMKLRRGFSVEPGARVLVVEDAVTTGGSVMEVIQLLKGLGAQIVGLGAVVDRSAGKVDFGVPFYAALRADIPSWPEQDCPLCAQNEPIIKPGSRK